MIYHEKGIFPANYHFREFVHMDENFFYPLHWHTAVEMIYIVENNFNVYVNNHDYYLNERDIIIISSGDIHGFQTYRNKGKRIFLQFDIAKLDNLVLTNSIKPFISQTRVISPQSDKSFHSALEENIIKTMEGNNKDLAYSLYLNARIYDILALLVRNFADKPVRESNGRSLKRIYELEKLSGAFKYIEENYQSDVTLKDAAKASGFSEYHFSRLFKEVTEKNFSSYLNEFRVKKAEMLLIGTDSPITQVAYMSGFKSISTFNRIFKEVKGYTPTEFKKMQI